MFDTSLVRSRVAPRRYTLFGVSLFAHSAVAIAAIAMSITSIDFPKTPPDQFEIFRPAQPLVVPPPLGTPQGAKRVTSPQPAARPAVKQTVAPITQPELIPEHVPVAEEITSSGNEEVSEEGAGPAGDPNGVTGGMGETPGGVGIVEGTGPLVPGGEVTSARVLRKVEPRYPAAMAAIRMPATVTVRCVIDKEGRIRDPEILRSTHSAFNQSVLDAVRGWTFVPGARRGKPVDTWFELTVTFRVR